MTEAEAIRENYNLGVLAGEAREQQHIIKLLEGIVSNWRKCDLHNQADTFDYAIALIKGEK